MGIPSSDHSGHDRGERSGGKERGFTGYTAASLSGVNCGVVFGAFLINWMNYRSALMIVGIMEHTVPFIPAHCIFFDGSGEEKISGILETEAAASAENLQGSMSTAKFLLSPHVLLYFTGIVIPVVAGGYFPGVSLSAPWRGTWHVRDEYRILLPDQWNLYYLPRQFPDEAVDTQNWSERISGPCGSLICRCLPALCGMAGNSDIDRSADPSGSFGQLWTSGTVHLLYGYEGKYSVMDMIRQWVSTACSRICLRYSGSFIFGIIYVNGVTWGLTIAGAVILAAAVIFVIFGEKVGSGEGFRIMIKFETLTGRGWIELKSYFSLRPTTGCRVTSGISSAVASILWRQNILQMSGVSLWIQKIDYDDQATMLPVCKIEYMRENFRRLQDHFTEIGVKMHMYLVDEEALAAIDPDPSRYEVVEDRDSFDYIYSGDEMRLLPGRKYSKMKTGSQDFCGITGRGGVCSSGPGR